MYLNLSGYHLSYDQEFSPGAAFNVSPSGTVEFKSQFDWGGRYNPSNHEAEFYSDPSLGVNPFQMHGGELTISASNTPSGFNSYGQPFVSGLITTQETFSQHGGYFEIRAKVAGGQGLWPAFWMMPTNGKDYPEIDILEDPNLNGRGQYFVHSTGTDNGGGGFVATHTTLSVGFHTYGVEWNDQTTTFYFDHQAIAEEGTPSDMAGVNMYLLANLAVGGPGSWPGAASATEMPRHYQIDYIRAFSNDTNVPSVKLQPISSPDGAKTTPDYNPPAMPAVSTGSGPQALTLMVSEDYFQGDAKFRVKIDGAPQGGVFTTIAPKGQGLVQDFVFNGSFAPGHHKMTVDLVNNVQYGEPYFERNLYVDSATIGGQTIPGGQLTEDSNGPQSFTFDIP